MRRRVVGELCAVEINMYRFCTEARVGCAAVASVGFIIDEEGRVKIVRTALKVGVGLLPNRTKRAAAFYRAFGRLPPKNPQTFNEKVNWRITNDRRELLKVGGDKVSMKEYVRKKGVAINVAEDFWYGEDVEEILDVDFGCEWVLKPISGSGHVLMGSGTLRAAGVSKRELRKWRHDDLARVYGEWVYSTGRKGYLLEERIPGPSANPPADVKFYVFDGRVKAILYDTYFDGRIRRRYYTEDWTPLEVTRGKAILDDVREPPVEFERMKELAAVIGAGFDFIRVDLYDTGNAVWFGEISPYPASGLLRFSDYCFDRWLGDQWVLPVV